MSSPAKRRKKNDSQPAAPSARTLDSFFFKKEATTNDANVNPTSTPLDTNSTIRQSIGAETPTTDELLARKLQAEWNQGPAQFDRRKHIESSISSETLAVRAGGTISGFEEPETRPQDDQAKEPPNETSVPAQREQILSLQSATSAEDTISSTIPFDESTFSFKPSKYVPHLKEYWSRDGAGAPYALLTRCFVLVNGTQSRIKIVDTLVNCLRVIIEGDPDSLLPAVWLATNSISPPYISLELGLGGSAISKALKKACGLDNTSLKALYDKHGDAGDVAFEAKKRQSFTLRKPKSLSIMNVYQSLVKIANSKGNGSQDFKQRIVERLLQDARGAEESRYIVRTLVQHLRIGAVKTTMLIALSRAFLLSRPPGADFPTILQSDLSKLKKDTLAEIYARGEELVKACFARRPNYNDLVPCLLEIGISDELLIRCGLALHIPLRPMLGSITRDLGEMLTKLQGRDFSCEYKYDGQRAQVHCDERGKVSIFSRHLEVMTDKYPDLVNLVPKIRGEGVGSFILEGEVVAVDRETGELKAFQTLTNRARKDVDIESIKVNVCLFAFDLMYLNGEQLLDRPFRERRELLRSLFVEVPNHFTWVQSLDASSSDSEAVLEFFKGATDMKCEGIMVKVLDNAPRPGTQSLSDMPDPTESGPCTEEVSAASTVGERGTKAKAKAKGNSKDIADKDKEKGSRRKALLATYEPDKRLDSWLKVKKDYNTAADTLDLIPIAAWHGSGRKAKWWSPILLAVRDAENGSLVAVTKCISGFTDKFYSANKERYAEGGPNLISRPSYVEYAGSPDVWFEPQEVWEMAFADITMSPVYTAAIGLVSEDRGLSLRFPRFLKVRDDKSIEEASTTEFLASLWRKQQARAHATEGQTNVAEEVDGEYDNEG